MPSENLTIGPYEIPVGRYYDPETHLWLGASEDPTLSWVGFDPLGAETSGDIVAVSMEPIGTHVGRGAAFGSLEAAKFVGPLLSPVSGVIRAHNSDVVIDPSLINAQPLDAWLMAIEPDDLASEEGFLLSDPATLESWLTLEIERFKERGMVAE